MKKAKPTDELTRKPVSHIPREVSLRVLTSPHRATRTTRERFKNALAHRVEIEQAELKGEQERYCRKLKDCTMQQLARRLRQTRIRADRARRIALTAPDKLRPVFEQQAMLETYRHGWVEQEIAYRVNVRVQ